MQTLEYNISKSRNDFKKAYGYQSSILENIGVLFAMLINFEQHNSEMF